MICGVKGLFIFLPQTLVYISHVLCQSLFTITWYVPSLEYEILKNFGIVGFKFEINVTLFVWIQHRMSQLNCYYTTQFYIVCIYVTRFVNFKKVWCGYTHIYKHFVYRIYHVIFHIFLQFHFISIYIYTYDK